jgi:hypothetical protein
LLLETILIDDTEKQTREKLIYFHPVFTTLLFVITLPYSFSLIYFCYTSWVDNKLKMLLIIAFTFLVMLPTFSGIFRAFLRLVLKKPAIRLTKFRFYDHIHNVDFRWADVKQLSTNKLSWWSYLSIENLAIPIIRQQINNPLKYIYWVVERFINRRKIRKINLFILQGKNSEILSEIIMYSYAKSTARYIAFKKVPEVQKMKTLL